jgi:hypothetical protein
MQYSFASSGGECTYYESIDSLREDLLNAWLDIEADQNCPSKRVQRRLARLWRKARRQPDYPKVTRVVAVERHTDAGWVPVPWEIVAPAVLLGAEATGGAA